jgi:Protein of unknown function (Hypoth_ymh)
MLEGDEGERIWQDFPEVIPCGIIDKRIQDLAVTFWDNPDDKILTGWRRLEDVLRRRTGVDESDTKLFAMVFGERAPKLRWDNLMKDGERVGRLNLFTGAYMAHRNPRAHSEIGKGGIPWASEFLLLNHLYILEGLATNVEAETK